MIVAPTLTERIKIIVERQVSVLETWVAGDEGGLTENQLERLEAIARIVRQLDLDSIAQADPSSGQPAASEADLLKAVGYDEPAAK